MPSSGPRSSYRNAVEHRFAAWALAQGWYVTKRGWPDFWCQRPDGSVVAVECKPRIETNGRMKVLRRDQVRVLSWLAQHGVEVYLSDGVGLAPLPDPHVVEQTRRRSRVNRRRRLRGLSPLIDP